MAWCRYYWGRAMGILVICSYRPKPGHEDEACRLVNAHVPLLRRHRLITARKSVTGMGKDGELVEIFEWMSSDTSRAAAANPQIMAHWNAMGEVMDFVPLASFPEAQQPFAHFAPV